MSFFTLLTLILALFNPVSDCGCFGDALILTNWQTFFKNVVLMVFVLILYFSRKKESLTSTSACREWMVVGSLFVLASFFSFWNYRHLPLLDFRPYDVGTVIREEMEIPEGMPVWMNMRQLIYRNLESWEKSLPLPWRIIQRIPLEWEFVTSESKLVKRGYEPPIHDFALMDDYGNDMVDEILSDREYSLLMLSYDLDKGRQRGIDQGQGVVTA